jgi:hypothetical protein
MTVYEEKGHKSRKDYLLSIADDFGLEPSTVFEIASILGSNEDFDGLISSLEDYVAIYGQK